MSEVSDEDLHLAVDHARAQPVGRVQDPRAPLPLVRPRVVQHDHAGAPVLRDKDLDPSQHTGRVELIDHQSV